MDYDIFPCRQTDVSYVDSLHSVILNRQPRAIIHIYFIDGALGYILSRVDTTQHKGFILRADVYSMRRNGIGVLFKFHYKHLIKLEVSEDKQLL